MSAGRRAASVRHDRPPMVSAGKCAMLASPHHAARETNPLAEQETFQVRMDRQGRLVVPAGARQALGAEPGEVLVLSASQGRLVIETRRALLARLRRVWARRLQSVDELLEARRDDAELERPLPGEGKAPADSSKRVRR
jgi:bifunctional DNA-binding transcriptional regulator/antitoxin component of YhaV-PrlF toxin-antitoxin module